MQVFQLAGRFRLPGCARSCVQALAAVDPSRVTEQEVLETMQLIHNQGFQLSPGPGPETPMGLAFGALSSLGKLNKARDSWLMLVLIL